MRRVAAIGTSVPTVNPSGGLKVLGQPIGATGAAQVAEIGIQLRGEAGARQVDRARTGLVHTRNGNTATVLISLLDEQDAEKLGRPLPKAHLRRWLGRSSLGRTTAYVSEPVNQWAHGIPLGGVGGSCGRSPRR